MSIEVLIQPRVTKIIEIPMGPRGLMGTQWRTGTAAPDDSVGVNGDLYLRTTTGNYYKRVTGVYVLQGSLLGPSGISLVDTGSFSGPVDVILGIPVPADPLSRQFITCSTDVVDPTIGNGMGTQQMRLYYVAGAGSLTLNSQSNLKLTGPWEPISDSVLCLDWVPGANKWTETTRNEMT